MNLVASVIFFCAGIGVFLFIQSVLPYTYLFSVFSLSLNNHEVIQKINAENSIKSGNNINESNSIKRSSRDTTIGLWTPMNATFVLQHLKGEEQEKAIDTLLKSGYQEYYYVMNNFEDPKSVKMTEELLETASKTNLKIIIILLPPSEGGPDTNYDWKGWIKYFNSLEKKYPRSFEGFTIDDFNWISTRNYTKFKNNIDFMEHSELSKLLEHKSKHVKFYPTVYFEGKKTGIVVKKYNNFIDGLVVASGCYYNVSSLKKELDIFSEIFKKPIRYMIYPTITYNYSKQDYSPPTDRLIMSTLSIASNSSDGLIIWRDLDNPVIQEHMKSRYNKQYLSDISKHKEIQISDEISDEKRESTANKLSSSKNIHNNCNNWSKKYNEAHDTWLKLPEQEEENDEWKKMVLH